jgi:hypothetical protein
MSNPCGNNLSPDGGDRSLPADKWQENSQRCSEPDKTPLITKAELTSSIPEILEQLHIESCKTWSGVKYSALNLTGQAGVSSTGCEQIQVLASTLLMNTRIQACMLNEISQTEQAGTYSTQDVCLLNDGIMDCADGFLISNDIDIDITAKTAMTANMASVMSQELLQKITESFQQQQSQKTGFLSTSAGQRAISSALTAINTDITLQSINCVVSKIMSDIYTNQRITVVNGKGALIRGASCKLAQKTVIKKMSESMVMGAISAVMDIKQVNDYFKEMSLYQDNVAAGASLGLGGLIAIIVGIIVAGVIFFCCFFKYGSQVMEKQGTIYLIVCLTIIVIIGMITGIVLNIQKRKDDEAKAAKAELDRKYPPCPKEGPCIDEPDPTDPNGTPASITLLSIKNAWLSNSTLRYQKDGKDASYTAFVNFTGIEGFYPEATEITMPVEDFVAAWNNLGPTRRQGFGTLGVERNGRLYMSSVSIAGAPSGTLFRVLGDLDWWKRMGFPTVEFATDRVINATLNPWAYSRPS